jgi:hypothetical protein
MQQAINNSMHGARVSPRNNYTFLVIVPRWSSAGALDGRDDGAKKRAIAAMGCGHSAAEHHLHGASIKVTDGTSDPALAKSEKSWCLFTCTIPYI